MPDILEDEFKKTLSNIKDFTVKSNNENTSISEIEKYLTDAADKNYSQENIQYEDDKKVNNDSLKQVHQRPKLNLRCDIKNDATGSQLDSGIGTGEGSSCFSYEVEEQKRKEEDKRSIDSSVTGSEYSPKTLYDIRFLKEIQNLSQKNDQCVLKDEQLADLNDTDSNAFDSEDSYDSRDDSLHFNYQNKSQITCTNSSDWSSEEDSNLLPEDSFLMKLEVPLTKSEKSLIDEFYQKMEEVEAQNDQERKDNIHNPNINCTENALKRIKCLLDEYLKRGIRLNASYNDSTVANLIFEKIIDVLDAVVAVRPTTHKSGQGFDCVEEYEEEEILKGDNLKIMENIIKDLLLRGGKAKRSYFYYDRLAHVTRSIDYGLYEKCEEIESELKDVAYESVINKSKRRGDFKVAIDNGYFCIKYEKGSIVELARITNSQTIEDLNSGYKLNLKVGILQIGSSIIRVEKLGEQRNYTDVPQGKIKMSFTIKVEDKEEKISILLYSDEEDSSKVKVELDAENQKKFDKLKDKSSLGKNCFLGGKSVVQAIQDKEFTKHKSYKPATPAITPTLLEQSSVSNIFDNFKTWFKHLQNYLISG